MELNKFTSEKISFKVLRTEKYWVHTDQGTLLDTLCGNTAFVFGFNNKDIMDKMYSVQNKVSYLNFKHNETNDYNDELVNYLCQEGGYSGIGYAISGTDGVECAISINDYYWKRINPNKTKIISFSPGYHGSTYLCRMMRGEEKSNDKIIVTDAPNWKDLSEREEAENISFLKLEKILNQDQQVGAIIFESIPWYMGIKPWSDNWWPRLRNLCDQRGILLILDDVMGCVGKLGYYFSWQRYNIKPDIVALGKALTGGYSPLSCACTTESIASVIKEIYEYGHTWQPNMAGIGAALAVKNLFDVEKIKENEKKMLSITDKLVDEGLVNRAYGIGSIYSIEFKNPIYSDDFTKNGLEVGPDYNYTLGVCVPFIADDEYFFEFEKRIRKSILES